MPRPRHVPLPKSDDEIIEEVVTIQQTKRGAQLKQTQTPMTQISPIETAKPSGSRSKSKKRVEAPEAEKNKAQIAEDYDIVQTYEPGNDFEYHPYNAPEEPQLQANVC